jgi:hypothetical protein
MNLFDDCDLDAPADAAAARKRWEFLLTAAPLPMPRGTDSPSIQLRSSDVIVRRRRSLPWLKSV